MNNKITSLNFKRQVFLKDFKRKIEWGTISSKVFKTGKKKLTELNYKRIYNILHSSLLKEEIFRNNNIYLILDTLQDYYDFLKEFETTVKDIESIDTLNDKQQYFFTEQAKLEKFLKDNLIDSKGVMINNEQI